MSYSFSLGVFIPPSSIEDGTNITQWIENQIYRSNDPRFRSFMQKIGLVESADDPYMFSASQVPESIAELQKVGHDDNLPPYEGQVDYVGNFWVAAVEALCAYPNDRDPKRKEEEWKNICITIPRLYRQKNWIFRGVLQYVLGDSVGVDGINTMGSITTPIHTMIGSLLGLSNRTKSNLLVAKKVKESKSRLYNSIHSMVAFLLSGKYVPIFSKDDKQKSGTIFMVPESTAMRIVTSPYIASEDTDRLFAEKAFVGMFVKINTVRSVMWMFYKNFETLLSSGASTPPPPYAWDTEKFITGVFKMLTGLFKFLEGVVGVTLGAHRNPEDAWKAMDVDLNKPYEEFQALFWDVLRLQTKPREQEPTLSSTTKQSGGGPVLTLLVKGCVEMGCSTLETWFRCLVGMFSPVLVGKDIQSLKGLPQEVKLRIFANQSNPHMEHGMFVNGDQNNNRMWGKVMTINQPDSRGIIKNADAAHNIEGAVRILLSASELVTNRIVVSFPTTPTTETRNPPESTSWWSGEMIRITTTDGGSMANTDEFVMGLQENPPDPPSIPVVTLTTQTGATDTMRNIYNMLAVSMPSFLDRFCDVVNITKKK
jgi:hypothetical protein